MRGAHIPAFHVHHRRWALRLCDAPYSRRTNFLRSYLLAADGALCAELDAGARVQPTNYVVSNVKRMPMLKTDRNIRSQFGIGEAGILLSWSGVRLVVLMRSRCTFGSCFSLQSDSSVEEKKIDTRK